MSTATTSFEFVITDPASNLKPGRSLQIRSRCMRGKNKRDGSRRAIQEKKRLEKERMKRLQEEHNEVVLSEALQSDYLMSSLSIVDLSGKGIDGEARTLLSRAFYYNVVDTGRTPLDRCVDLDCLESTSFSWLFTDSAFLHSVLSSSFANNDFRNPGWNGRLSQKTIFHVQETLSLLQIKMQDPLAYQDDTALQAILNLTLMAAVDGDWIAASAHLGGMKKIVHLRGNESFLVTRPLLHFKLDRIDLTWSLSLGRKPAFAQPVLSWDRTVIPRFPPPTGSFQPPLDWDDRLANVFADLQCLSVRVNRNRLKFVFYNPTLFQKDLSSIQSRLMYLGGKLRSPVEELVRLTMLALLTTMFRIPGRKVRYQWVARQMKSVYAQLGDEVLTLDSSLNLWILMFAAGTVANTKEKWVADAWAWASYGLNWPAVKYNLMRIMWFEVIHDEPGEKVCHSFEDGLGDYNVFQDSRNRQ